MRNEAIVLNNGDMSIAPSPTGDEPTDANRAANGPPAAGAGIEAPAGSGSASALQPGEQRAGQMTGHAIIAGYGLPGRAVAEALDASQMPYCVIERNLDVVNRCTRGGVTIIEGDASSEDALTAAGVGRASLFAVTIPNEVNMLASVEMARRLNPSIRILARCEYLSTGLKAARRGADEVVVAEQAVATEFGRLVRATIATSAEAK